MFLFRRNLYDYYEDSCQNLENGSILASEVDLHRYSLAPLVSIKFPKTNRLILSEKIPTQSSSLIFDLKRIFSSAQLTELVISDKNLRLEQLLLFLHHFSNIKTLTIPTTILYLNSPQSETNRLIFNKNHIMKINLLNRCTLEDIQILNRFCPYVQSLDVETENDNIEVILRFLLQINTNRNHRRRLSKTPSSSQNIIFWQQEYSACINCTKNQQLNSFQLSCNHHLSSICFRDVNYTMVNKLRTRLRLETLLDDYTLEYLNLNMYIWW